MKRAIAASCFAFACFPHLARAGEADDGAPPALPPLPAPPAPASTAQPPADGPLHRLAWSVDGGYAHYALYGVPINSAALSLIIGANFRHLSVGGIVDGSYGSTVDGLRTLTVTLGPLVEGHFGILGLGAGLRWGLLAINRATETDSLMSASLGAMARVTVDLLGTDSTQGVFLVGRATIDGVGTPTTPLYGVMVGVGVRSFRY
jgi:hypothetical protein